MNEKDQQRDVSFYTSVKDVSKAMKIKDLGALTKGLQTLRSQLIEAVKVRVDPTETVTRPLVEYIQSCTDCSPIIDLWDYQTNANIQNLECLAPDIVSLFIRLCNTPILRAFGVQLVQSIMQRHMKSIYRGVASARVPQSQSAFRVLIAMASFNQTTSRDLFQTFNFQAEGFSRACRYRQQKKSNNPNRYLYDLRTLYVQFVMAFFIHGDSDIKKQVLGVKGLVNGVFTHIDEDAYQLIEETLNATYEHLISDHRIPRSAKLALFTPYILEKIGKIYGRQDPEAISATDTGIPADLVHHFLLSICTVPGIGVCFKDAGWYPPIRDTSLATDTEKSDQVQNKSLAKFILSLKPSDDMRQQELLLKILQACPELVQAYWKSTALTLEVRLSSKWLGNATFLQKVIQLAVPSFYFGNTQLYPATPPNAITILDNILPSVFNRSVSGKGLQHSSALVRFATSNILSAVFQKFSNVAKQMEHVISILKEVEELDGAKNAAATAISTLEDQQQQQKTELPSAQWQQCLDTIREELRRRLPEIHLVIKLHSEVFGKLDPATKGDPERMAQREILQVSVFRMLRYYQECVPLTFMENHVDPSNLIPADILSVEPSILVHLLELLLSLSDFRWSNKSAGKSVSHITTLLTLYLRTPYDHIRDLTARLVNQTLSDSFMFKHDPEEVDLWLHALPQNFVSRSTGDNLTMSNEQESVLRYLDDCFTRFGKAQYRYTDQLVELVGNVTKTYNEKYAQQTDGQHAIFQSLIDGGDGLLDNGSNSSSSGYSHPFSPLLLVLLERLQFIKTDIRPLVLFVTRLFLSLQTKQKLPFYLETLVEKLMDVVESKKPTDEKYSSSTVDMDVDHTHEDLVGTWDTRNMVRQTKICLTEGFAEGLTIENREQDNKESPLDDIISGASSDNLHEDQQKFVQLMGTLPVTKLINRLNSSAAYCADVLKTSTFGPLVDYISDRHPLAMNLFGYPDLQNLDSLENESMIVELMKKLPFHILFYNAWGYSGDLTFAKCILEWKMARMNKYELSCSLSLILQKMALVTINSNKDTGDKNDNKAIQFCLTFLQVGLNNINDNIVEEQANYDLKHLIYDHPVLKYLNGKLATLLHQLGSVDTYPSSPDFDLIDLCVQFPNIFCEGVKVVDLLNKMVSVDFDALYSYCNRNSHGVFYNEVTKLLICLINNIKQKALSGTFDGDQFVIPGQVFSIIARMWRQSQAASIGILNADILSLLELDGSGQLNSDSYRQSQRHLLNECGELVVKHILDGHSYLVDMSDLRAACKEKAVPVSSLVLDTLSSVTSLPLTAVMVQILGMGYHLASDDSSTDNDSYLQAAMGFILKTLTMNADTTVVSDVAISDNVFDVLVQMMNGIDGFDWTQLDAEAVRDFILTTLLDNISNSAAIRFTTTLVEKVYSQYTKMEPLETYIRRILDHSLYQSLTMPKPIDVLLKNNEASLQLVSDDDKKDTLQDGQRAAIIELLGTINDIQPMILANHHGLLDSLLTSYGATTLPSDRRILGLLLSSERHGDQTILPKLLMWGPGSDKARQEHAQAGTLLKASTISVETFGLIHREMMRYTFLHMPSSSSSDSLPTTTGPITYDPQFFLPLFANLIASGTLDCRRFIEIDALGLTVVSMSSLDEQTRKIGYQMMDQFYVLLEHSNFKGKFPIKYLLDMFKQAIVKRSEMDVPPRISSAVCLCVAQCLSILMLPSHYLLSHISKWMTRKPNLDLNYIPMFVALFDSTSFNQKKERLWILQVLASSIRTMDDYKMYSRHRVWDLTASYYNSPMADTDGKLQVLEMIRQAVMIPTVALRLIQHNGLLTWLHQLIAIPSLSGPSTSTWQSIETNYTKLILAQLVSVVDQDSLNNTNTNTNNINKNTDGENEEESENDEDDDGDIDVKKDKIPEHIKALLSNQLAFLQSLI
ncbi:ribosome 60S biogenesis N-terminal-domain-containing protein [Absidia repens]|uniref:Ribosome 60S biogenesis N-terminal-domain-containing protein n=1 Tax=Absidia repens TaxID=90262 RepID=A0A1X2IQT3_9FUNG|nr:ribosome 60S biogenesis N-terminal-domain-containing protein [Absidia repens]